MTTKLQRIVLAFSGSRESSTAIPWLAERYGAEVVCVTIDLGQGRELEEVRDRALANGAVRAHVLDSRDEFARGYVLRALKAGAMSPDAAPIWAALARPLIAQQLVQIAGIEQATAIAHCGKGAAIDEAARMLNPALRIVTPARETPPPSLPAPSVPAGRDGGGAEGAAAEQATVDVTFERGVPTGINGVSMPILDLIDSLGTIAAAHGVGRPKSRDLRDAPAAPVLHAAHRALRLFAGSEDLHRLCAIISREYADLICRGFWFAPAREALDAFVNTVNERMTGIVRLRLFNGECEILDARDSPPNTQKVFAITAND